ncbi:hypothetical protein niasHT_035839 [Heterodera trifolii]|uniref:Macoilin n=1 Tax=Heterodera trifolii TaxID=157864 RepID=A0ABD2IHH9_9BILA
MKRYRAVDVPPKFRRTAKGRNTRLGDSVYFSRFFSAYNLVYLKFFLIWVCCIALDFLIGFRFELLWPVLLLVRHLYESFRVHAFSSSLHYSAFSVFFVCVTATSDLVCYLFIPIQVLIFLASTYVWVQFVYQSSDRGVCLPSLFLWALFIVFEYSVRYRFDNATWYLTRTSWITAGLFPSTADSVSIGLSANSSSSSSTSSTRLELYRPFAAHCIGFPVVTLGFRVKSFFSNWRMRVRREEVKRQNEFFERLLADAIPTPFENRKHFISSRSNLAIDPQEVIDNVTIGLSANSSSSSSTSSTRLELYRPFAAHCIGFPVSTLGYRVKSFLRLTPSLQRVLESAITQLTGGGIGAVAAAAGGTAQQQDDMISTSGDGSNVADEEEWDHESVHFHQNICTDHLGSRKKSKRSRVVSSISHTSTIPTTTTTTTIVATAAADVTTTAPNFISSSGHSSLYNYTNNNNNNNSIIKLNGAELNGHCGTGGGVSSSNHLQHHHHQETDNNHNSSNECALLRENAQRLSEIRQLQKERQTLELSLDKMKVELKGARSAENELRVQLKNVQQREQSCREEWKQFEREQKQRVDQLESKCKQLAKQNDYFKMNTQALERRVGELQLKKSEVERELTNERLRNSTRDEPPVGRQQQQHNNANENGELKQKMSNQDRELKALRKDLKAKNEQCNKFDDELRQLRSAKTDENKQMDLMREKNLILEQTLSAENKLKQDLFRALNDSKAEIATLKARLYPKQTNKEQQQQQHGGGPSNGFHDVITSIGGGGGGGSALFHSSNGTAGGGGLSSSSGSSPTILQQQQHHQRQFSSAISQQKSLTPPPLSVGSSTFNPTLEQLLQATQNMSYSLSPLNSNGGMNGAGADQHDGTNFNSNGTNNSNGGGGSSPFSGTTASDMLAVGGHRSVGANAKTLL